MGDGGSIWWAPAYIYGWFCIVFLVCPENIVYFFFALLGTGCLFRSIELCVFQWYSSWGDCRRWRGWWEGISSKDESSPHQVFLNQASSFCFVKVVCNSYLTWGVLQKRIVTQTYEKHFPDGSVTCFSCSISSSIVHSPATPHCTPLQVFLFVLFKYCEQLVSI